MTRGGAKTETHDIVQYLYDHLQSVKIDKTFCKQDTTTKKTGSRRADVWISTVTNNRIDYEPNIIAIVEAKHKKCVHRDEDWKEAMQHGKSKAEKQGLNYYIVTNCKDSVRFYNRFTDTEIKLDGKPITKWQPLNVLAKIQTQTNATNSDVIHKGATVRKRVTESDFKLTLWELNNIYRSCGISKPEEKIQTTLSFIILKYISEKEEMKRTLSPVVRLWNDYGMVGNYKADIESSVKDILSGDYGTEYKDFKDMVVFSRRLKNDQYRRAYELIDTHHQFHGCGFDIYGAIYEEFATNKEKEEFGEYYTRRHITGVVSRLLLRSETIPREFKICDPACGTGGFLTEAFKTLQNHYDLAGKWNQAALNTLKRSVFYGFDHKPVPISLTVLNMFLVGDGHTNITERDSLAELEENFYDYVVANPPYGDYKGEVDISTFDFTNERKYELLFIEKMIKAAKYGGELAIVVPDGVLETPTREKFRKKLLEHVNIRAIISLTKYAFAPYTSEKTYVLFMQRKQEDEIGTLQKEPIWHYIVDYDGYANSDKRFRTERHDDLIELEKAFLTGARGINANEKDDGLHGSKCGFVQMSDVNAENFHNLLSEFHLRNYEVKKINEKDFALKSTQIRSDVQAIAKGL